MQSIEGVNDFGGGSRTSRAPWVNSSQRRVHRRRLLQASAWLGIAAGVAFGWRALTPDTVSASARDEILPIEYYGTSRSFSEVEQARTHLTALSGRYLHELEVKYIDALDKNGKPGSLDQAALAAARQQLIQELEQGLREFQGTAEEATVARVLLRVLDASGAHERWVQVYLDLLYRRPTEDIVGQFATTAIKAGTQSGRLDDVLAALHHAARIPAEFPAKNSLQAALSAATLNLTQKSCSAPLHSRHSG